MDFRKKCVVVALMALVLVASGFMFSDTLLQFYNGVTYLGNARNSVNIKCSTGMSCTKSGQNFTMTATGGTGTFSGPGSSVNNDLVSFSGTGGATGQDSGILQGNVVTSSAPGAGLARFAGGTQAATSAELSGDATTSGSNAVTVAKVNGNTFPANAGFTSGGVPFFSSTSAMGTSTLLTANGVVLGGGSGAAPTATSAGAADTMFGVAAAVPPVFTAIPNCPGATGYSTSSHAFVCTLGSATIGTTTLVTAAAASAGDQNLQSIASSSGTLSAVGKHVHLHTDGSYTTGASGQGTMTFKVKMCTVAACGSGTVNTLATFGPTAAASINASAMPWSIELDCFTTTAGASGVLRCSGTLTTVLGTTATALGGTYQSVSTSIASSDLTVSENWQVTVAAAGNSTNNSTTGNVESVNWLN